VVRWTRTTIGGPNNLGGFVTHESLGHLYERVHVEGCAEAGASLVFLFHMDLVVAREAI
jgi:hypothetical protein